MSSITNIRHAMPIPVDIQRVLTAMDEAILDAVKTAKAAGLPQGFIVALLHGYAHSQTAIMVS